VIYYIVMIGSLFLMVFFYSVFIEKAFCFIAGKYNNYVLMPSYKLLFTIIFFALLISLNPFIHHRYMFPIIPLISLIYFVDKRHKYVHLLTASSFSVIYLLMIIFHVL